MIDFIEQLYNQLGENMFEFIIVFLLVLILLLIILIPKAIKETKQYNDVDEPPL